jgi:hypothetical protein
MEHLTLNTDADADGDAWEPEIADVEAASRHPRAMGHVALNATNPFVFANLVR